MYRTIDAAFWTDSKVRRFTPNDRLFLLYLITNPHTHVSGLYYLPLLIAQHETGLPEKAIRQSLDTLSKLGICRFDEANEFVWVRNMFRYQGPGSKNTLSAAHHLSKDCHDTFLIQEFAEMYPEVGRQLSEALKNRVSLGYTVGATPDSPFLIPDYRERIAENGDPPAAEKRAGSDRSVARRQDAAANRFSEAYLHYIGNPYDWASGDFPQLARLRKRLKLESGDTPDGWDHALVNYFRSPFAKFSLQHFASEYDTFKNSAVDRYKVPVNHVSAAPEAPVRMPTPEDEEAAARKFGIVLRATGGRK